MDGPRYQGGVFFQLKWTIDLRSAIERGQCDEVDRILTRVKGSGASYQLDELKDGDYLHLAVEKDHYAIVECLLKKADLDVNLVHPSKATPLHIAVKLKPESAVRMCELLIKHRADISRVGRIQGRTPLQAACARVTPSPRRVIEMLTDRSTIHYKGRTRDAIVNWLPHYYCVLSRNTEALQALFEFEERNGCDLDQAAARSLTIRCLASAEFGAIMFNKLRRRPELIADDAGWAAVLREVFEWCTADAKSAVDVADAAAKAVDTAADARTATVDAAAKAVIVDAATAAKAVTADAADWRRWATLLLDAGVSPFSALAYVITNRSHQEYDLLLSYVTPNKVSQLNDSSRLQRFPDAFEEHPVVSAAAAVQRNAISPALLRLLLDRGIEFTVLRRLMSDYGEDNAYLVRYESTDLFHGYWDVRLLSHLLLTHDARAEVPMFTMGVAKLLLENGASANAESARELPPLCALALNNSHEITANSHESALNSHRISDYSHEHVAKPSENAANTNSYQSVAMQPTRWPFDCLVRVLLKAGADPFYISTRDDDLFAYNTPDVLLIAAVVGNTDMLHFLLSQVGYDADALIHHIDELISEKDFGHMSGEQKSEAFDVVVRVVETVLKFASKHNRFIQMRCKSIHETMRPPTVVSEISKSWNLSEVESLQVLARKRINSQLVKTVCRRELLEDKIAKLSVPHVIKRFLLVER